MYRVRLRQSRSEPHLGTGFDLIAELTRDSAGPLHAARALIDAILGADGADLAGVRPVSIEVVTLL